MGLISILLLVLLAISSILLVLLVLLQDEQGEGLTGIFGGGTSSSTFGSRTGNVLTRFTAVLAAVFLFCCLGLAYVNRTPTTGNVIGAARSEALQGSTTANWWAPTTAAPATTGGTGATGSETTPGGAAGPSGTTGTTGGATGTGSGASGGGG